MAILLTAWIVLATAATSGRAADRLDEFNRMRRSVQAQLRSKDPADRIEALHRLEKVPIAESAKLIHTCLSDQSDEVREAAYRSLVKLSDNQEVCDALLLLAKKAVHRKDDGLAAAPILAALLSSNLPSVERQTNEFLQKSGSSPQGTLAVVTLADELGHHGEAADVAPLANLSKTKIFADQIGVRRAVVQALTQISAKEAVGALVEMLDRVGGEARADAAEHLTQLTGEIFGMEAAGWKNWWHDSQVTFEYPKRKAATPYRSVALTSGGDYYGLPLFAERLVFILDTSGSMTGPRIVAAKRELV
ncbi:MAG TPA: HEAT repeat domain-containing protein, partial [Pirellulales bacterium]|nr:HEAT repeat domain-containing protein [Pirellulales bacterium]